MEAAPAARGTRIMVFVATLLAATNMIDFIFYGKHAHDLLAGIGMALIAHAAYHGGFRPVAATGPQAPGPGPRAYSSVAGAALMIASIVLKYAWY